MTKQGLGAPTRKLPHGSARSYVPFAALGDSATAGVGDRAADSWRGWARLLAASMAASHDVSFCNAAVPGATAAQVGILFGGRPRADAAGPVKMSTWSLKIARAAKAWPVAFGRLRGRG